MFGAVLGQHNSLCRYRGLIQKLCTGAGGLGGLRSGSEAKHVGSVELQTFTLSHCERGRPARGRVSRVRDMFILEYCVGALPACCEHTWRFSIRSGSHGANTTKRPAAVEDAPRLVPLESLSVRRVRIERVLESDRLADSGGVALDAAMPLRSFVVWAYSRSQLTAASVNGVAPGTAAWHVPYLYRCVFLPVFSLLLTKAISEQKPTNKKMESFNPQGDAPKLCTGGCGFFGSAPLDFYCSVCFKKARGEAEFMERTKAKERKENEEKAATAAAAAPAPAPAQEAGAAGVEKEIAPATLEVAKAVSVPTPESAGADANSCVI